MKVTHIAGWMSLGALLACGKPPADTTPAEPAPASTRPDSPPPEQPPNGVANGVAPPAEPAQPEPAPADGEFGITDCDTYMQRVAVCDPYEKHPDIGKLIIDKWRRLKAEGNLADLEKLCSRALALYECQAK
ncbi:hypothetical protein [Nannocystis sp.]|uniref:hypothetical protein n=1 Tax=Nannocystis sp. TaxID=1962667 RepID=UPI00242754DF|nr:hypothetical protein [Nannocystis sp.]MBK7829030.1 hypothetical protein [Nannocystis sp.]MBK9757575.1 hypothetical protein [Nannocystis sp.]